MEICPFVRNDVTVCNILKHELWANNSKRSVTIAERAQPHLNKRPIIPIVFNKVISLSS